MRIDEITVKLKLIDRADWRLREACHPFRMDGALLARFIERLRELMAGGYELEESGDMFSPDRS
jgi:hypothetical protein